MTASIDIKYVDKLLPILSRPKRIKIIVGGRNSTKSTIIADMVAAKMSSGELWCCARETLNSIEESVHRTLIDEINRLEMPGFVVTKTSITHPESGGRSFYKGLSRNIASVKSTLSGIDGLWLEEGEDVSTGSLRVLSKSVRLNATDSERLIAGEEVKMPEIIITMNRGTRTGAIAQRWLARAEPELERCGFYEDDLLMIVELNYTDMPRAWFEASGLEEERQDDFDTLSRAAYDHIWHGRYLEEVADSIIKPEWVDAAIDAHKVPRLIKAFEPHGPIVASHDPSGGGTDDKGFALRHGSIIKAVKTMAHGEIDEGCDWATGLAHNAGADWFVWDADGMGAGLERQIADAFRGTKVEHHAFRGSLAGSAQDNAETVNLLTGRSNQDTYRNNRAQHYIKLSVMLYNTFRCVERGEYVDPGEMISIDSDGVDNLVGLKSELCRIPRKHHSSGLDLIMSKQEMKLAGIESPNQSDSIMMSIFQVPIDDSEGFAPLYYEEENVV